MKNKLQEFTKEFIKLYVNENIFDLDLLVTLFEKESYTEMLRVMFTTQYRSEIEYPDPDGLVIAASHHIAKMFLVSIIQEEKGEHMRIFGAQISGLLAEEIYPETREMDDTSQFQNIEKTLTYNSLKSVLKKVEDPYDELIKRVEL